MLEGQTFTIGESWSFFMLDLFAVLPIPLFFMCLPCCSSLSCSMLTCLNSQNVIHSWNMFAKEKTKLNKTSANLNTWSRASTFSSFQTLFVLMAHSFFSVQQNVNQNFVSAEPILSMGSINCVTWPDNWTTLTADGSPAAQFEHTLLITKDGAEILTKC